MKKILMVMFLSLMSINVFGLVIPPLKCVPNPCTKDYEACNTNDGTCYCSSGTVRMNDGTCDFLGDTFTEEYFPTITEPGIYTGYLDDRYTNAYKSSCASGITIINPLTGLPNPILTGKDRIYEMYLSVPQIVTLKLKGVSEYGLITLKNPVLSILKASNKEVVSCHDNISITNKNSQIIEKSLPAGVYYVVVDTVNTTDYGKYELDVTFKGSCLNISCGNDNGDCVVENNVAHCNCDHGFTNPSYSNLTCVSVCANKTCPSNSVCVVSDSNQAICDCNVGYTMTNGLCVDNCNSIYYNCGEHGTCIHTSQNTNEAECSCDEYYSVYTNPETLVDTCRWISNWGGSLDSEMGDTYVGTLDTSIIRNDMFDRWEVEMLYNQGTMERDTIVIDPHGSYHYISKNDFINNYIFQNDIWYNVTHGGYYDPFDSDCDFDQEGYDECVNEYDVDICDWHTYYTCDYNEINRYTMYLAFGDNYDIDLSELYLSDFNGTSKLVWFSTNACHSGDNKALYDENGKKYYPLWNLNVKNMMSSNIVKNPNGYFGTDGIFDVWLTTDEQGEDFAWSYAKDKSHLKYAWQWSYEDWWIRNDSRIVYTGKDKSDCFSRMGKDYFNPNTSETNHRQTRLAKDEIKNYCYRLYYNNWDEDRYKSSGELDE